MHDSSKLGWLVSQNFPVSLLAVVALGCSSGGTSPDDGTGGDHGVGGAASSTAATGGNASGSGGATATRTSERDHTGGATASGGTRSGASSATGGAATAAGGTRATGGSSAANSSATGGMKATGGVATIPTSSASGGSFATGGVAPAGGAATSATGGAVSAGGTSVAGGSSTGGSSSTSTSSLVGPCDIYAQANTPCVAAHSTVRALYAAYNGPLYEIRRASDKTTQKVPVLSPGGFADISVQDTFCKGTTCTISVIYDQSENKNDLAKSPVAYWLKNGGNEANAADGKTTVSGHTVHGIYVTGYSSNVAYRNNSTKNIATGDQAESMYMVVDGKRYSDQCCFDYGNAETSGNDDGNGTMEAVYFGSDTTWGGKGDGKGPWVAGDLENGVFKSDKGGWKTTAVTPAAKSIVANYVTAMLKGPSGNHFTLKGGDAQSGKLTTMWDASRPSPGYSPKKLQGAIILGTGGDGSNGGTGTFFEGAMTKGNPPDSVDDAIQANIIAAGYGR